MNDHDVARAADCNVINGAVMLVSRCRWFELPSWLAVRGSLSQEKYSYGVGVVQVRALGAIMLAVLIWVCLDASGCSAVR